MNTRPDIERIVTDWLHDDVTTAWSDEVLAGALVRVASVGQERIPRPWRFTPMNTYAKLAIGVAAVAVVAVVGINLLAPRSDGGVGGPAASAAPSPSPLPSPKPSPPPSPAADFPPEGPISAGTHRAVADGDLPFSFTVPTSGWRVDPGNSIGTGEYPQPDYIGIDFWLNAPDNVYTDACAHAPLDPAPSPTTAGLASAVAGVPYADLVSGPSSTVVGGHPAQQIVLTIKEDLACDPHDAYLWYDESSGGATGGWRWAEGLGATYRVWIIDVDGKPVWIDAYTFPRAKPELDQEIQGVIDSITFE
jgi:hypothetical protein